MSKYKTYDVTVDILRYDGKMDHTRHFLIKAQDAEDALAIVHNQMVFSSEPKFRVSAAEEVISYGN